MKKSNISSETKTEIEKSLVRLHKEYMNDLTSWTKRHNRRLMINRMILQNIEDLIPYHAKIEVPDVSHITIKMPENTTVQTFVKKATKIARMLNSDPYKGIGKKEIIASWHIYISDRFGESQDPATSINLILTTANTEKCDLVETVETYHSYKLTGYCKSIAEANFVGK